MHADRLLVLTDVPAVMTHFGTPRAAPLSRLDLDDLARMRFPAGSMGPKIAACRRFVAATGRRAAIGSLSGATAVTVSTTRSARAGACPYVGVGERCRTPARHAGSRTVPKARRGREASANCGCGANRRRSREAGSPRDGDAVVRPGLPDQARTRPATGTERICLHAWSDPRILG
ncbi:amino acid kinase family protein [Streptomyces sp. 3213.3]|uniref:amino acid kinase family protein n=1 Tax=Streptomyces sp. 3213.3 TaxID=1855348 RepID=UPI000A963F62